MRWRRCGVRNSTSPPRRRLRSPDCRLVPENLLAQVERGRRVQAGVGGAVPSVAVVPHLEVGEAVVTGRQHRDRAAYGIQHPAPGAVHRPVGRRAAPSGAAFARRLELDEQDRSFAQGAETRRADEDEGPVADARRVTEIRGGEFARVLIEKRTGRRAKRDRRGRGGDEKRHEQEQDAAGHSPQHSRRWPGLIACA